MSKLFPSGDYQQIAVTSLACLRHTESRSLLVNKPRWWNQYTDEPEWLHDITINLTNITSFEDGRDFIASSARRVPEKHVKGWIELAHFTPLTHEEEIEADLAISHAYGELGDHHRSVEFAWRIPDKYLCDVADSVKALQFISSELNKLGEYEAAAQVNKAIPGVMSPK